ncbi:MAG: glycerol-3-phosphate 1-O-acyltransferase PlsY [Acetanaerobacterium sp.]
MVITMGMRILYIVLTAVISYLLGSISFAVIVSRALTHKDVRDFGSGNAGLTNVVRTFGKLPGILTLLGDFSKGVVSVVLGRLIFEHLAGLDPQYGACVAGLFVIIGHIFPIYFGFKGGKGVLTTAGIALMIDPRVFLIAITLFILIVLITRIVSIASIIAAAAFPITTFIINGIEHRPALVDTLLTACIAAILIFMHRANIKRLLNGTEPRFERKKKD